jgi:hypothetical protein
MELLVGRVEAGARGFDISPSRVSALAERVNRAQRDAPVSWIKIYHLTKGGKLAHASRTKSHALREAGWRGWTVGEDGVEIREAFAKADNEWGTTRNPYRFGGKWPTAKEREFAKLYTSGMPLREMEEYFDAAISMLGKKRQQLGLPKRSKLISQPDT